MALTASPPGSEQSKPQQKRPQMGRTFECHTASHQSCPVLSVMFFECQSQRPLKSRNPRSRQLTSRGGVHQLSQTQPFRKSSSPPAMPPEFCQRIQLSVSTAKPTHPASEFRKHPKILQATICHIHSNLQNSTLSTTTRCVLQAFKFHTGMSRGGRPLKSLNRNCSPNLSLGWVLSLHLMLDCMPGASPKNLKPLPNLGQFVILSLMLRLHASAENHTCAPLPAPPTIPACSPSYLTDNCSLRFQAFLPSWLSFHLSPPCGVLSFLVPPVPES